MTKLLPAIYENGAFRPLNHFSLPEHQKVLLAIAISQDDLPSVLLTKLAEESKSFQFLNNPQEDIYTTSDGEEV
jgi:predicted DNA-binding antitoxin AbrB/MazE fold protein